MTYANYADVVEAISRATTRQQLCDIADDADALFVNNDRIASNDYILFLHLPVTAISPITPKSFGELFLEML